MNGANPGKELPATAHNGFEGGNVVSREGQGLTQILHFNLIIPVKHRLYGRDLGQIDQQITGK